MGVYSKIKRLFKARTNQADKPTPKKYRLEIEAMRYCNCGGPAIGLNWHSSGCKIWEHKHEWVLIDKYDSWNRKRPGLPKGQWVSRGGLFGGVTYIPGFDYKMMLERIIDTINEGDLPHHVSETWACHCGKRKTNSKTTPSIHAALGLSQQLPQTKAKKGVRKNA